MAENEKGWPLLVAVTNETPEREYLKERPMAVFNALMAQLHELAVKHLQQAERLGEVRRLELYCFNTKTPKEKE